MHIDWDPLVGSTNFEGGHVWGSPDPIGVDLVQADELPVRDVRFA